MNFNCIFGDLHEPLLNQSTDYFYPAITNFNERVYKQIKYVLNSITLVVHDGRIVLGGFWLNRK